MMFTARFKQRNHLKSNCKVKIVQNFIFFDLFAKYESYRDPISEILCTAPGSGIALAIVINLLQNRQH